MPKRPLRTIADLLPDVEPVTFMELRLRPRDEQDVSFDLKLPRERFPIPELMRFVMMELGCEDLGRGEKVAWQFPFLSGPRLGLILLQKFGLRLSVWCGREDVADARAWATTFVGRLEASQRSAESQLHSLALRQYELGNVTLRNQYQELRETYLYFREGARLAFAGEGRIPERSPDGGYYIFREQREGSYNVLAMCTAYFSLVEHVLALSLPFLKQSPSNVRTFIGQSWSQKYRCVFGTGDAGPASVYFTRLAKIAERHRNTYAHGAFGKEDATIYFHVEGVGAIPGNMTAVKDSPQFALFPTTDDDFDEICATFDEWEQYLASSEDFSAAWRWVTSGLDVRFDSEFLDTVSTAVETDDFDALIHREAMEWERRANMDF